MYKTISHPTHYSWESVNSAMIQNTLMYIAIPQGSLWVFTVAHRICCCWISYRGHYHTNRNIWNWINLRPLHNIQHFLHLYSLQGASGDSENWVGIETQSLLWHAVVLGLFAHPLMCPLGLGNSRATPDWPLIKVAVLPQGQPCLP